MVRRYMYDTTGTIYCFCLFDSNKRMTSFCYAAHFDAAGICNDSVPAILILLNG